MARRKKDLIKREDAITVVCGTCLYRSICDEHPEDRRCVVLKLLQELPGGGDDE